MTHLPILLSTALLLPIGEEGEKKPARASIYDAEADAGAELAAAVERAARYNRRVLIQWGADWCGWCHLLHDTYENDRKVRYLLNTEYELLLVDVGRMDRHMDLAEKLGADLAGNGLPFLTIVDGEGKVVTHQETASLERQDDGPKGHDGEKVAAFLQQHAVVRRKAKEYLDGTKERAAAQGKTLFLHFGADWCGNCRQLEKWLKDPDVEPLFRRDFVELKIDTEKTRGGRKLLDRTRTGERGGIPWFALYGTDGKMLIDSNRTDGKNVGYPKKGESKAHFQVMLEKGRKSITDEELEVMLEALSRY